MQIYELGYLILPSIAEDALAGVVDKLKGAVAKAGGNVFDSEDPFKYDLAYTMSKTIGASRYVVNDAYIGWLKFESDHSAGGTVVESVKDELAKMDELLRFLLVKTPRETTFTFAKAKAAMAEKAAALVAAEEAANAPTEEVVE